MLCVFAASSKALIIGLCILFLLILPLIVIGAIVAYRYRYEIEECFGNVTPMKRRYVIGLPFCGFPADTYYIHKTIMDDRVAGPRAWNSLLAQIWETKSCHVSKTNFKCTYYLTIQQIGRG